jgi:hypothetical protein
MPKPSRGWLAATSAVALSLSLALVSAPAALSDPGSGQSTEFTTEGTGRGPDLNINAAERRLAKGPKPVAPDLAGLQMPASYPFQPELKVFPHDDADASYRGDLIGYADLAPRLNALMKESDRISAQVVGQSSEGRDLYLITVTAPEKANETKRQNEMRDLIKYEPVKAARDKKLKADYKTPIWFSANIHGNEWEGTDAELAYIEDLVTAPWSEVGHLLSQHRLYFSLTLNPDGRFAAQRATALGFDPNRDMITNTNPESVSYIRTAQALQPLYTADLHGYTSVLQVEPTGPPHGENYEYDLFIPHNYAAALRVERDVVAANIPGNPLQRGGIKIPYRDTPSGWDDYPPIFTAQYAAFYGALTSTVELPLSRTGGYQTPARAAINTAVAEQTIRSLVEYVSENSDEILDNQIEFFRRGVAGEPKTSLTMADVAAVPGPEEWKPLWDVADDQDAVTLPRAYIIPVGDSQRSLSDATSLVRQLLTHDVEVRTLNADQKIGGTTYPRGSFVIDMHQAKRGLANALLDLGSDISNKIPSMYDISAWSYSYLWGATVDKVGLTTDAPINGTKVVNQPPRQVSIPARAQHLTFEVAGVTDYRALNALLAKQATVSLLPSGQAVVAPGSHAVAVDVALDHDIVFRASSPAEIATVASGQAKALSAVRVAYTGNQDDRTALAQLGFDSAVPVTAAIINANPDLLDEVDVIWVGSAFTFSGSQARGRAAVQAWLDKGHGMVGRGSAAFSAASSFGLVSASTVSGNSSGNGIVAVDTPADSVFAAHPQPTSFVYPALSFTNLGAGTKAQQTYAAGNPLLAGHWRGTNATNGPETAAGKASVISAETATGAKALVFGTSVFYRTHPKGGMSQAAGAIFWATPDAAAAKNSTAAESTAPATVGAQG